MGRVYRVCESLESCQNVVCRLTCVSFQTEDLSVAFRRLKASGRERDQETRSLSRIFWFQKNILRTQ